MVTFIILKDRRKQPEEGMNRSQSKIPHENLAYVPNSTRRTSLLSRSRPYSYRKVIDPWNRVRQYEIIAEDDNRCNKSPVCVRLQQPKSNN
jgi:hypothetical protein